MKLLKQLCEISATSGNELAMKEFILDYVKKEKNNWVVQPEVIEGPEFQDCLMLKFGKPQTAVFAHMDSIGFTVRYENQLIPIGGPEAKNGYQLVGQDDLGPIECELSVDDEGHTFYKFGRSIQRGTDLVFKCNFRESNEYIQSCYLDNRLGIYCSLKMAKTLQNGLIVFSTWEEHGGGSVPFLIRHIYKKLKISQALVCDITWITDGILHGKGVVVSMRDRNIPRQAFVKKIIDLANESGVDYQLEVEGSGSSDGRELQHSPYPIDWCFIGAPEDNVHSPDEIVHKRDIESMIKLYQYLLLNL
ncbi:MAG: M20/M25/M40 family metallo-hydrolase [Bacteroidetes bacterium]|nr:M20/M25/M40 family metallo-hydrolase [Bacteroidota bacterium]MDA1120970.1 M20/M25/M40 family metallo-hydrolase [Bacteroidota bacterium]